MKDSVKYGILISFTICTLPKAYIHGVMSGLFFMLPILSIIAMFEKKGVKYIAINAGYWVVTLAIMGGIICQWL